MVLFGVLRWVFVCWFLMMELVVGLFIVFKVDVIIGMCLVFIDMFDGLIGICLVFIDRLWRVCDILFFWEGFIVFVMI